jgi:hypothetical protein
MALVPTPKTAPSPKGSCLHCSGSITEGVAYISAGALLLDESLENSLHDDRSRAFMNVGLHGRHADMSDSSDVEVVSDIPGGQFDLSFCGLNCLRIWFSEIVDKLESDASPRSS